MDLQATRAMLALAQTGSVLQAAQALSLSRTTLRRRIMSLSTAIGVPLVEVTPSGLVLTEAGLVFVEEAPAILRAHDSTLARVLAAEHAPSGVLRVAALPGAARPLTQVLITKMMTQYPSLRLELLAHIDPVSMLDEGVDLALSTARPHHGDFVTRTLGRVRSQLFASPDYLQKHPKPNTLQDLSDHTMLHVRMPPLNDHLPLSSGGHVSIAPKLVSNDASLVLDMVHAGQGIALLPALLGNGLVPVLEHEIGQDLPAVAVMAPARAKLRRVQIFLQLTQAILAQTP